VCGTQAGVKHVMAPQGQHIDTAFIERVNLTTGQPVAAVGRRVMTLRKSEEGIRQQLALYQTWDNRCLPHAGLRRALPQPQGW
jgi:hypothetical protein